jgi:hypothetical protein
MQQVIFARLDPAQSVQNDVCPALLVGEGGVKSVRHFMPNTLRKGDDTSSPLTPTVRRSIIGLIHQLLEVENMPVREKTSVRLDPEIVSLGRKLAKKDFGSEQKLGLLIENAIRSYHARQVQPVEASSLLSATEQALIDRIEKRVEHMGKQTVERIGNLMAKSSFETALNSIILEQMYSKSDKNAKANLEHFRHVAAQRMKTRFDKENAERISSLIAENQNIIDKYNKLLAELKEQQQKTNKAAEIANQFNNQNKDLTGRLNHTIEQKDDLEKWTRGLIQYLEENSSGLMKKPASKLVEEYTNQYPKPRGI